MGKQQPQKQKVTFFKKVKPFLTPTLSFLHKHRGALVLIFFLLAFHSMTNYFVMRQDTVFFDKISALHYIDAAELSQEDFRALLFTPWRLLTRYDVGTQYPIIFPGVSALFLSLFGFTQDTAVMSNLVWLTILLPSIYAIALKLFNKRTALFSTLLVSFFPGIVAASRGFVKDLPLTAMVALSLAVLLQTDGMKRRVPAILFGLSLSLTALTHGLFILFLPGPFLIVVIIPLIKRYSYHGLAAVKAPLVNCLIAATIVLILAGPWYLIYALPFLRDIGYASAGRVGSVTLQTSSQVVLLALRNHLSMGFFILAIYALVTLWKKPEGHFSLGWILPAAAYLGAPTFVRTQFIPRYLLPSIPALAIPLGYLADILLGSIGGNSRRSQRLYLLSMAFTLCLGMLLTLHTTFLEHRDLGGSLEGRAFNAFELSMGYRLSPVRMEADIESAVAALREEIEGDEGSPELFITNSQGILTQMVLTELEVRQTLAGKRLFTVIECLNIIPGGPPFRWNDAGEECIERLTSADYMIIEDMNSLPLDTARNETFPLVIQHVQQEFDSYKMLAELPNWDIAAHDSAWLHPESSKNGKTLSEEEIIHYYFNSYPLIDPYAIPDFINGRVLILKAKK